MQHGTLFLCGDVMTGRGIDQILPHPSSPILFESYVHDARDYVLLAEARSGAIPRAVGFDYVWGDAQGELRRVAPDARIVNLETSITRSDDAEPWKGINYRMHPDNIGCLAAAEIDVCVLANNHVLDWGEAGLLETLDVLLAAGIRVAGAGRTRDDAVHPAVVPLEGGGRVIVLGVGHPSSGIPPSWGATPTRPGVWLLDEATDATLATIRELVQRMKQPGDVVVASIHWGSNWGYHVTDHQVGFAPALIEGGVDLVHGHSSHHARPIEIYKERLILYGCGDFLSDYEGIRGHEEYRGDLPLMYFPEVDRHTGFLRGMRMVPLRMSQMRLGHALAEETTWLGDQLGRISRPFGTDVVVTSDGALALAPKPVSVQVPLALG
jgi:poly-gamma-glutamate synthesis protein (capsule biosynthesis protein)